MCELTCENFYSELPAIEAALKKADFVSIDMEFSKIDDIDSKPFSYFDSHEERYNILRSNVADITCIQLGLSIYTYDINSNTFKACAYSIYTYPQTFFKSDSVVYFQTACVEFLSKHEFDFNKLFSKSVSYLTDEQEIMIKSEMLNDLFFDEYFINTVRFRTVDNDLDTMLNKISNWYSKAEFGDNLLFEVNEHDEPACIVLLQYRLLKKYKNVVIDKVPLGLSIVKVKQNANLDKLYTNLKQNLLNKMMGVKYILKLLFELKKPIIGHNCSLDILILYNQFFQPLPENFKDFQSLASNNFGQIYDTKLLFKELKHIIPKSDRRTGNSLSEIYLYLKYGNNTHLPNIELFGIKEPQDMKLHHAGWDAYYTGYCFIKMIDIFKNTSNKSEIIYQKFTLTELLKSVESYKNKLYTNRSISNFIDLESGITHTQKNYLVIQNKGIFYKALDVHKLVYRLNEVCTFDMKLISRYTALIITPCRNKYVIIDMKSDFFIEEYSNYQKRKRNQYLLGLGLIMIGTPVLIFSYLKKYC